MELTQAREEREQTIQAKSDWERDFDQSQERLKRASKLVERLSGSLHGLEQQVLQLSDEHQLQGPLSPSAKRPQDKQSEIERYVIDSEAVVSSLSEWVCTVLSDSLAHRDKALDDALQVVHQRDQQL